MRASGWSSPILASTPATGPCAIPMSWSIAPAAVRGDYTASAPALIAEVLSPSTAEIDLGDKAAEYLRLPTLSAYLVFAQSEPKAWAWIRERDGFPPSPGVITGYDKVIHVPALKLALPLGAVFAGVDAA